MDVKLTPEQQATLYRYTQLAIDRRQDLQRAEVALFNAQAELETAVENVATYLEVLKSTGAVPGT